MMAEKRQISDKEKTEILNKHGRKCFIDGEPIGEDETVEFHHILPFSMGGPSVTENIAPLCKKHHRSIGTMTLQEYRDQIKLKQFFADGNPKILDDLIKEKNGKLGETLKYKIENDVITIYYNDAGHNFPLFICPATNWTYFYATLPFEKLINDKELQPRALREASLWILYRHFLTNTQLAPSICRINDKEEFLLFDGQHKAAAQIWAGKKLIECKVYIKPDERVMKETNLDAHGRYRQMSFYSHELMEKYATVFGDDWKEYMESEGTKSEDGFSKFLINIKSKSPAIARKEIAMAHYNQIIIDPDNKISNYLTEKQRGKKRPLTFARLSKTFFQHMMVPPPVIDEFESDTDFRNQERQNLINLMNIVVEEGLEGKWNPELADEEHKKTARIFSAGAIRAWVILLKDVINTHMRHYSDTERAIFFYCKTTDEDFEYIRQFVKKIFSHKIWSAPDPAGEIAARLSKDDALTAKTLFDEEGLTAQYILGHD